MENFCTVIYYINNLPLNNLQLIVKNLRENNFQISYFDSKKLFLNLKIKSLSRFNLEKVKEEILNKIISINNSFLIPVAVCINKNILNISVFLKLTDVTTISDITYLPLLSELFNIDLLEIINFVDCSRRKLFVSIFNLNLTNNI